MKNAIIEASYPITFRGKDAEVLGSFLRERSSVQLIGMRRVGISNFLRFFLYHKDIVETYVQGQEKHLFISVDLNDLVERELYPFWMLTLKRIVDSIDQSHFPESAKKKSKRIFTESIQLKDLFFTLDSVQKLIALIISYNVVPTLFFLRFDMLKEAVNPAFFDNLQGLKDSSHHKLSFVFTSFRTLAELAPEIFKKQSLSVFSETTYIKPAEEKDSAVILKTFEDRYRFPLSSTTASSLVEISGGHVQYLQLSLIKLHEDKHVPQDQFALFSELSQDERIVLQSEELFDSLTRAEKEVLLTIKRKGELKTEGATHGTYLWDTGFLREDSSLLSPLFDYYLEDKTLHMHERSEFTKKEHVLFTFLKGYKGQICEREDIVEAVWPEYAEICVSDWAVDRLVARLRQKLRAQGN